MKTIIWTKEARDLLYQQLVSKFGAYKTWEKAGSPGNGKAKAFDDFCEKFAKVVGAKSAKAVRQQMGFALPVRGRARWGQGHACCAILNLSAAIHAGFIDTTDVPNLEATPTMPEHPALRA